MYGQCHQPRVRTAGGSGLQVGIVTNAACADEFALAAQGFESMEGVEVRTLKHAHAIQRHDDHATRPPRRIAREHAE